MTGGYHAGWVLASFTALTLVRRVAQSKGGAEGRWLIAGALSMGVGIWAMHVVGSRW